MLQRIAATLGAIHANRRGSPDSCVTWKRPALGWCASRGHCCCCTMPLLPWASWRPIKSDCMAALCPGTI